MLQTTDSFFALVINMTLTEFGQKVHAQEDSVVERMTPTIKIHLLKTGSERQSDVAFR